MKYKYIITSCLYFGYLFHYFAQQVTDIRENDKNCEICGQCLQFSY